MIYLIEIFSMFTVKNEEQDCYFANIQKRSEPPGKPSKCKDFPLFSYMQRYKILETQNTT